MPTKKTTTSDSRTRKMASSIERHVQEQGDVTRRDLIGDGFTPAEIDALQADAGAIAAQRVGGGI